MRHPVRGVEWQVGALSVRINRGDLVVVCGAPRTLSTLLVLLKARLKGARSIWWGQYWTAGASPRRQRMTMRLVHLADAILFYTDAEVARFHAEGWRHRGPVGSLNNGLDLTDVVRTRQPYQASARGRSLLFIGRLTAKADLGLAIHALARPELSDVTLHVIGDGDQRVQLRAQAEALNVADRIVWHGGTTDERRIGEVANRCAAFIYPGQVGLSLIHAMGYGLPCLVHGDSAQQMPEIAAFEDGKTGRMFERGSVESLAQAAVALLETPAEREAMAARCIQIVEDAYTTARMAERFLAFADRLMKAEPVE
ncbi:glycosyltransferase [Roseibacterium elongatum DSM 19469]|uniref:Glycosyltransferase n=2 Tax=Roseicyclus elongatus TaxID=159346 RepID=W8S0R2_9RHOB|nr:glycosyltransferase [Roseibacterium elongatum DSM 19469]